MSRTDAHAPSNFDPADYCVVDYLDNKRPEPPTGRDCTAEGMDIYRRAVSLWQERIFAHFPGWRTGGTDHQSVFTCNHCGHPGIRWVAVVEHVPTGAKLAFGEICADRCELPGRNAFRSKFIKTQAEREAAALANAIARESWKQDNPDVAAFLNEQAERKHHPFISDMIYTLNRYGKLSERQVEATRKFMVKAAEFAARDTERAAQDAADAPTEPLAEGRRHITGIVLSTKWQDNDYGMTPKMLVKQADGNKVWGTVPEAAFEGDLSLDDLRNRAVEFTATVQRSRDDEHFGFYKRPTGIVTKEVTG